MNFSRISNSTVLGKVLRSPLRLIPSSTVVPILQGPLRGKKWIVGSSTHGCWVRSYEYAQQTVFAQSLSPEGVVYDLGASVGFYSLLAGALVGPAGRVYAFEPLPRNVAYLRKHVALNRLENCFVFEAAVADSDGSRVFTLLPMLRWVVYPIKGRIWCAPSDSIPCTTPARLFRLRSLRSISRVGSWKRSRVERDSLKGIDRRLCWPLMARMPTALACNFCATANIVWSR